MVSEWLARQSRLIGEQNTTKLINSRVAVIGLGGVGGAAAEALARTGIGHMLVLDCDVFDVSNLNRQILATTENIGKKKCEEAQKRILSINPACEVDALDLRLDAENLDVIFSFHPDYIIDAIDCVTAKLALIEQAQKRGIPIITSMGTGNRINAHGFVIGDIASTAGNGCGLSKVMRRELKKRGVFGVTALYATLPARKPIDESRTPASISFVPPIAGYLLAGHVVRSLIGFSDK